MVALGQDVPEVPDRPAKGDAVTHLRGKLDRAFEMGDGRFDPARVRGERTRLPTKCQLVGRFGRDLQGELDVA